MQIDNQPEVFEIDLQKGKLYKAEEGTFSYIEKNMKLGVSINFHSKQIAIYEWSEKGNIPLYTGKIKNLFDEKERSFLSKQTNMSQKYDTKKLNEILYKIAQDIELQRPLIKTQEEDEEIENLFSIAIEITKSKIKELFSDNYENPFSYIEINDHLETVPIRSSKFKIWLSGICWEELNKIPSQELLTGITNILSAEATFKGQKRELFNRVAYDGSCIVYDLGTPERNIILISSNGIEVQTSPETPIFRRFSHMKAQVIPNLNAKIEDVNKLRNLINIKYDDEWLLTVCWLIATLFSNIPRPILVLYGPKGSAKTTAASIIRRIIDPSYVENVALVSDESEMARMFSSHCLPIFDNITTIDQKTSDLLCKSVTGAGFEKRALYTNEDVIIFNFRRSSIATAIGPPFQAPDLIDRTVPVELEKIDKKMRRKEDEIYREFDLVLPDILGSVFKIASEVLKIKDTIQIDFPRMADFALIGEAAARVMGYKDGEFLNVYHRNINIQAHQASSANVLTPFIEDFVASHSGYWEGTPTELFDSIMTLIDNKRIAKTELPKSPTALSRRLAEMKDPLEEVSNIIIQRSRSKERKWLLCYKNKQKADESVISSENNQRHTLMKYSNDDVNQNPSTTTNVSIDDDKSRVNIQNSDNSDSLRRNDGIDAILDNVSKVRSLVLREIERTHSFPQTLYTLMSMGLSQNDIEDAWNKLEKERHIYESKTTVWEVRR